MGFNNEYDDDQYDNEYDNDYTINYDHSYDASYDNNGDEIYDDGFDALYDAMMDYNEYYMNRLEKMDQFREKAQAVMTELGAMGQIQFSRDDQWDNVAIINNAAAMTEDDNIYYDQ